MLMAGAGLQDRAETGSATLSEGVAVDLATSGARRQAIPSQRVDDEEVARAWRCRRRRGSMAGGYLF